MDKEALIFDKRQPTDHFICKESQVLCRRRLSGTGRIQSTRMHEKHFENSKTRMPSSLRKGNAQSTGQEQREILNTVSYYKAFQELLGGVNHNPQNWGEPGWSLGEVQHFGEPLPVEINRTGELYLATLGTTGYKNSTKMAVRSNLGAPNQKSPTFGMQKAEILCSGAAPGETVGLYQTPVDVELSRKGSGCICHARATGRIQVYDTEGQPCAQCGLHMTILLKVGWERLSGLFAKENYLCAIIQDQGHA